MSKPTIHITAPSPKIDIHVPMGNGPALPSAGLGGYSTQAVLDDISQTVWEGQEPLTESVPLLLDGLADNDPVQREWNVIKSLGRPNGDRRPPVFRVWGPIDAPEGKAWVLPEGGIDINADSVIKQDDGDALLRIEFTLHLLEYRPPGRRRKAGLSSNTALIYTTRKGDTLHKIAAKEYGKASEWKRLTALNPKYKDPNRILPAGRDLKV